LISFFAKAIDGVSVIATRMKTGRPMVIIEFFIINLGI